MSNGESKFKVWADQLIEEHKRLAQEQAHLEASLDQLPLLRPDKPSQKYINEFEIHVPTGTLQADSSAPRVFLRWSVEFPPPPPVPLPWLPVALAWVFPARFYKEVLEQTISDMHIEYAEAKAAGQTIKARWVLVCALISILKSLFLSVCVPLVSGWRVLHALWRMFIP